MNGCSSVWDRIPQKGSCHTLPLRHQSCRRHRLIIVVATGVIIIIVVAIAVIISVVLVSSFSPASSQPQHHNDNDHQQHHHRPHHHQSASPTDIDTRSSQGYVAAGYSDNSKKSKTGNEQSQVVEGPQRMGQRSCQYFFTGNNSETYFMNLHHCSKGEQDLPAVVSELQTPGNTVGYDRHRRHTIFSDTGRSNCRWRTYEVESWKTWKEEKTQECDVWNEFEELTRSW